MVLQRAGDNLRRGGGSAVRQHHERDTVSHRNSLSPGDFGWHSPSPYRYDLLAVAEEHAAHRQRLFHNAAAVVPEIEYQTARSLRHKLSYGGFDLLGRILVECLERDVADAFENRRKRHGRHVNLTAREGQLNGPNDSESRKADRHARSRGSAQALRDLRQPPPHG
jgi:hypothetical protein